MDNKQFASLFKYIIKFNKIQIYIIAYFLKKKKNIFVKLDWILMIIILLNFEVLVGRKKNGFILIFKKGG